ncbi:MAG: CDP-diacylglycerol--glycerol-3-phosphate 3-phosphatidyltransferase [Actinomycetota bacterium]
MQQKPERVGGGPSAVLAGRWLNAANLLTVLRAALAPPIIALLLFNAQRPPRASFYTFAAGVLFVVAALTDKADGYYARKTDSVTRLGQFLDPLADKLLVLPVMIALWYLRLLPLWVVLVVLARELLISGIRIVGARKGISFPASWSGKIKMFSQIIVISVLIFFPASASALWARVLVYLMAAITAYSGVDYVLRARREVFSGRASEPGAG